MANNLQQFLRKHTPLGDGGPRSISMAIELIRPFLRIIRTGACPRASVGEVDTDHISDVLSAVLPAPAVVAVSLSEPLPKPPWMRAGSFQDDRICDAQKPTRDALMSEIRSSGSEQIAVLLRNRYYRPMKRALGNQGCDDLERLIVHRIVNPITPILMAALVTHEVDLGQDDTKRICDAVQFCLGVSILLMLGYTILDKENEVYRFARFVNVLESTLPLYRIGDNEGEMYIVLCP